MGTADSARWLVVTVGVLGVGACDRLDGLDAPPSAATAREVPVRYVCPVALVDPANPCQATLTEERQVGGVVVLTPCDSLDHVAPREIVLGAFDCFYAHGDGQLAGWDLSSDIPAFCGESAHAVYAGDVPDHCTFLDAPGWQRVTF
jgi:hypothetical protein